MSTGSVAQSSTDMLGADSDQAEQSQGIGDAGVEDAQESQLWQGWLTGLTGF